MIPSLHLKLNYCLKREAPKGMRLQAAGQEFNYLNHRPASYLFRLPPCSHRLLPAPALQTTEHLPFLHPLPRHVEMCFGFLTLVLPKVSLGMGLSHYSPLYYICF